MLPEGSEQVKVEAEELNPLQINSKQTYLVELSYAYYGAKFRGLLPPFATQAGSALFPAACVGRPTTKSLRGEFQRSLYTWQNL